MTCSLDLFLCVAFRAGTTDAIFISSKIQEKYIGKNSNLYFAFVDLEKVFDRVPGKVGPMIGWSVRKVGPMVSQSVRKVGPMVSQPVGQKGRSYGWSVGQKGWSYSQLVGEKGWSYGWSFGQKGWSYGRSVGQKGRSYGRSVSQKGQSYGWSIGQKGWSYGWLVGWSERSVLWWALMKVVMPEWTVRVAQIMYQDARRHVRINNWYSDVFNVQIGVHQY